MANKVKLTKRSVDAVKPTGKRFVVWDNAIAGFGVRVTPAGHKTYIFKYRVGGGRAGRVRWGVIGQHGPLTPDQAREIAQQWAADIAAGGDPAGEKVALRNAPTVGELLDLYLSEHVEKKNKPKTLKDVTLLVNRVIRPALGRIKVSDINGADVMRFHNAHAETPYQANRALAALSKAFTLSELWGMRPDGSNPCRHIERFKEKARERFLSEVEFQRLGQVLEKAVRERLPIIAPNGKERLTRVNPQAIRTLQLLIFTGARVGEILKLRWEYIDLKNGRASLPDSKGGKKVIQLPAPALAVLAACDRPENGAGFVIRGGRKGVDPETQLKNVKDSWGVIRKEAGLEDVHMHDLRHAFASVAVAGGHSLPMIGALLGHKETRTTQRYAHLSDDPQRAAAKRIAERIEAAMAGAGDSGEVIPMVKKQ